MTRMRMRRSLAAAISVAAVLGLAACDAIPSSGPVQTGLSDLHQAEQPVQFNPLGPVAGATQEDIVRGFVLAASSSTDDYAVAREFLAPGYADQWDPSFGVLVDDGNRPFREEEGDAAVLELSAAGKVDADGLMLPVAPGASTDMRFELELVGGEWRIASAPAGIILDRSTFLAIWSSHQIYFVGPTGILVPETRWFQSRAALATEVVSALLVGPGERLASVVHSGFPPGTELVTGAVTVVDGIARIELSQAVLEAGPQATEEMHRQLQQSLRSVVGVNGFEVVIDGVVVREPETSEPEPTTPTDSSNPAVMMGGEFGTLVSGEFFEGGGLGRLIVSTDPQEIVLSPDEAEAAVRVADGVSRVDLDGVYLVDGRPDLLEPTFDSMGYIWTHQAGGELRVSASVAETGGEGGDDGDGAGGAGGGGAGAGGGGYAVEAPWLEDFSPAAISVSPDGSKLAVLVPGEGGRSIVYVAGIVRDADGAPVRTTLVAEPQMWAEGSPVDLDWVDTLRFAALTKSGNSGTVTVGGPGLFSNDQGAVPGGAQIASGGSRTQLRVLSANGDLYISQGSGWQKLIAGVESLAKRG